MIDLWVGHKLPFLQIMRNLNDARKVSSGVGNGKPLNPNDFVEIVKFIILIFFLLFSCTLGQTGNGEPLIVFVQLEMSTKK